MAQLIEFLNEHEIAAIGGILFLLGAAWLYLEVKNAPVIDDEYAATPKEQAASLIMEMLSKYYGVVDRWSATVHAINKAKQILKEWENSKTISDEGTEYKYEKIKFWSDVIADLERRLK